MACHVVELAASVVNSLKLEASNFEYILLVLYESTDVSYTAQLAIFVCGVDKDFNVTKEVA